MSMGNEEMKSTMMLTKCKLKSYKSYMIRALTIITFMVLFMCTPGIISVLKYKDTVVEIKLNDYSYLCFIGMTIAVIVMCATYRQKNDFFSVFPQTNTSRFLSTQIIMYILMIFISVISFFSYLIQFVIFKLMALYSNNIVFAFKVDVGLLLLGILVYLMYGILMITFISFIATMIRKFNIYAIVVLLIIISTFFTSEVGLIAAIKRPISYLIDETSIIIFFLKALITWLILCNTSILINKYTIYYKTQRKYKNGLIAFVGIFIIIAVSIIRENIETKEAPIHYQVIVNDDDLWKMNNITVDASEYDDLSNIDVVTNIKESDNMFLNQNYNNLVLDNSEILISYRFPVYSCNHYNLTKATNPKLTVTLEDYVLDINYSYDKNVKVVFLPPWYMMKQFEIYQDNELFSELPYLYNTNSRSSGHIDLFVE